MIKAFLYREAFIVYALSRNYLIAKNTWTRLFISGRLNDEIALTCSASSGLNGLTARIATISNAGISRIIKGDTFLSDVFILLSLVEQINDMFILKEKALD